MRVASRKGANRRRPRVVRGILLAAAAVAAFGGFAQPAAADDFTWSGSATSGPASTDWSNGANWAGGIAPGGAVGAITFPALPAAPCAMPQAQGCLPSTNDVAGISAQTLTIGSTAYYLTGESIQLGSGGMRISASDGGLGPSVDLPVILTAAQTWNIATPVGGLLELGAEVSGGSVPLAIAMADGANLEFAAGADVGPISVTGSGTVYLPATSLNGADGDSVSLAGGSELSSYRGASSVGALSVSDATIQVGQTLSVTGGARFGTATTLALAIYGPGTSPGTDYSHLTATGPVDLGGSALSLTVAGPGGNCPTLRQGDVLTLVSTSGTLTGEFAGVPDGSTISVFCGATSTLRVDYNADTATATVVTAGVPPTRTRTALSATQTNPIVNEPEMLTATVVADTGAPTGTVAFDSGGAAIAGCAAIPLSSPAGVAVCPTVFAATSVFDDVTATFTPGDPATFSGSADELALPVGRDPTASDLSVTPSPGGVTLTDTVTPVYLGPAVPTGTVDFLADGSPVASCIAQPLARAGATATATCGLGLTPGEQHFVTARYDGDSDFIASLSPAKLAAAPSTPSVPGPEPAIQGTAAPAAGPFLRAALASGGMRIAAILNAGGTRIRFVAPQAGIVRLNWYTRRGHVSLARGRAVAHHAGSVTLTLALTRAGRRLLRNARRVEVIATARFSAPGRPPVDARRTLTLRR